MSAHPDAAPEAGPADDRRTTIAALEADLAAAPRATRPFEHACLAYRLGLAYAETPMADGASGLRKALACYETAASLFDPRFDPVEHGRVLNAAAAAHRGLGNLDAAAPLFERAAGLLTDRGGDECAAAWNNLGLVRTELGDPGGAVGAFDRALALFDTSGADGRRGRAAALHNRGLAHAALGTEEGWAAALADHQRAGAEVDADEAPYHHALVHLSIGVTCHALAGVSPERREQLLHEAVGALREALTVFAARGFPLQHGLAKHNLGVVWAELAHTGDRVTNLRRALASFEDATTVLDPRRHGDQWRQAYARLAAAGEELASAAPGASPAAHFAALAARVVPAEREVLVRERLLRYLALPERPRRTALGELADAVAALGRDAVAVLVTELSVLMELPNDALEMVLRAQFEAIGRLPEALRETADRSLDDAIGEGLGGPQRVFVRDFLYSLGWERP